MKILNSSGKNFDKSLENLLLRRKKKIQSESVSVASIVKDVKKNGDKALVKYEKKFNQNKIIIPSLKQINKSINSLDKKVKRAIDTAYNRIYKFHSLQKFKNISYTDKLKNKLEYKYVPLESVAIYVPGSTASYPLVYSPFWQGHRSRENDAHSSEHFFDLQYKKPFLNNKDWSDSS